MYVRYCKKCNHFYYSNRISNYCKKCRSVLVDVPDDFSKVSSQSLNERYRLAYKLTNGYNNKAKKHNS